MKVLFLSQGRTVQNHPGWEWSLRKLKEEGFLEDYLNIPWIGYGEEHGFDALYRHVVELTKARKFDVVFFHYFHNGGRPSPECCIRELKSLSPAPVVLSSVGDAFSNNCLPPYFPPEFKGASRAADITFATQMGKGVQKMLAWGAKRIILSPNSLCPVRFTAHEIDPKSHRFDFDVVMIESRNGGGLNPLNNFFWKARQREQIVRALSHRFGKRFAVFGHGWGDLVSAQGPVPFDEQQNAMCRGRILVGGNPYTDSDYYSSNRLFFEVASGIPTVEWRVNRLEKILRADDQVYFAGTVEEIIATVERLLKEDSERLYARAACAAKEMVARHTQYHRLKFQLTVAREFQIHGDRMEIPFDFFLPEVELKTESRYAYLRRGK